MRRILLIDDEPHMLQLLERIITEKTSYAVKATNSSLEVPQLLERDTFDLIITDLRMPGMDGLEIIDLVKSENRWEKVVLITAFGSIDVALSAQNKGAFDYITKPFKKEQILFVIERTMAFQEMRRELKNFTDILDVEFYESAEVRFKKKFVEKLAQKFNHNYEQTAHAAGLTVDEITDILEKQ